MDDGVKSWDGGDGLGAGEGGRERGRRAAKVQKKEENLSKIGLEIEDSKT